jgi:hypothetical protein
MTRGTAVKTTQADVRDLETGVLEFDRACEIGRFECEIKFALESLSDLGGREARSTSTLDVDVEARALVAVGQQPANSQPDMRFVRSTAVDDRSAGLRYPRGRP